MEHVIIRARWQITLPRYLRSSRGLWIGQTLSILPGAEGTIIIIPGSFPKAYEETAFQKVHGKVEKRERADFRISHGKPGPSFTGRLAAALAGQDSAFLEELRRRYGGDTEGGESKP